MKNIDFTHTGGFPLTQDRLDFLQQAYTECVNALAGMGVGDSTPVIVSGMELSLPTIGEVAISDGWFFYGGELIKFNANTLSVGTGGTVPVVQITVASTNLTYNDGSVYAAINDKSATFISSIPITDASHFPYSSMLRFQQAFGAKGRDESWSSISVSTDPAVGGVSGLIYYKKNILTNTLQIRGSLTAANAQNFAPSPLSENYLMSSLPSGYTPGNTVFLVGNYYMSNDIKDDMGITLIKTLNISINSSGQISVNWIKPEVSVGSYAIVFNAIIPLD